MFLKKILDLKGSLLFRLTILYAGIFTLSSLLILSVFYLKIHSVTMGNMDDELIEEVENYSRFLNERGIEGVKAEIADASEKEDPNEELVRLFTSDGDLLATTDTSTWGTVHNPVSPDQLPNRLSDYVFETLEIPGREFKARMISAHLSSDMVIQIGDTFEDAENYLQIFRNWFLLLLFPVTAIAALAGWFMSRRALLDVDRVTQTAHEISEGAYDRRVQVKDKSEEIKKLGDAFNKMLNQIEKLLRSMREVNDNIAHDLRSPLARIRGIAEMTLMKDSTVDEYKKMAASSVEECDRLIEMINTMLDITEVESGINEEEISDIDISVLVRSACDLFGPIADEKQIRLSVDVPGTLLLRGDRKKVQRIVSNLLDNAIKYTPEKGSVSISTRLQNESIILVFEDTGVGISEKDIDHIFDRFYKCDKSRSRNGVGLGLSLVKAFTEAMKGTIHVSSNANQGSRFTVILPLQRPSYSPE